jgi:tetratricopeptide (TPR) repeat protein
MADQEVNDMPRTDPEAAREVAVKHLFRHLRDDQQLLRNPLVGPDLLGGKFTAQELRAGVARAATIIRDDDARLGRFERGKRQSACLLQCDLGSQSVASLAGEFEISPRQLARERHQAWIRALPHILTKTAHLTSASLHDLVHNRALVLFRAGRARDAAELIRAHVAKLAPEAAVFSLCGLALMQHDFKKGHDALETYKELNAHIRSDMRSHSRLNLALCLLTILLGQAATTQIWNIGVRDLVRRATLEAPADPWMSRTILRLLFALAQKFLYADELRSTLAISCAIDDICPEFDDLDCYETFSLHTVKAISEWKQNGFTVDMEAHTLRLLHLALSNGWTSILAEGASMLASVYYLSGNVALAQRYRDVALSGAALTDDKSAVARTYNNLAIAALDAGCIDAAAEFGSRCLSANSEEHPVLQHLPLTRAEILIRQGHAKRGAVEAREVFQWANRSGNQRLVATAGRVVALGLEAAGERREAVTIMNQSVDLANAGCCSKFDVHRIDSSYRNMARLNQLPVRKLGYLDFCG